MGLKCSVLGHAYGETTVERDREERGSEVVITIRELETCDRCGDTRVVTENKEVTTIEAPGGGSDVTAADAMAAMDEEDEAADAAGTGDVEAADVGGTDVGSEDVGSEDVGTTTAAGPSAEEIPPAGEDDAEVIVDDAEGGDVATDESAGDTAAADPAAEGDAEPSGGAVEDQGAEILDAEASADEDAAVDDELADPTIENEADVPGDSSEDEDAVILEDEPTDTGADDATESAADKPASADASDSDAGTVDDASTTDEQGPFDPPANDDADDDPLGEWPEETLRDDEDSWTPTEDLTGTVGDTDPDADVDRDLSTNSAVTVPEGEFHCEECGYTTAVEASSLRAGDFCPECRTGTLIHQPEE